jgi:hypothetical protein
MLLYGLIVTSLLGALVTHLYRIETAGVNLDEIGEIAEGKVEQPKKAVA